jgi:hypothetical protein
MHTTQRICSETGMLASSYCPRTTTQGVVSIPIGHPLYNLLGQYQSVIEEYLGSTAVTGSTVCTLHNEYYQEPDQTENSYPEAQQLLSMADSMLTAMDPNSEQYRAVLNAADYLRLLVGSGSAAQGQILAAMTTLTQALGGIY